MSGPRIFALDPHHPGAGFPDPNLALSDPAGLLAVGGCLSPTRLLNAYRAGIFPWYEPGEPILWWSPDPRTVFATDAIHVSRSLRRQMRKADYAVTLDRAFFQVIAACASVPRPGQRGTWLGADMRAAYAALHQLGHAHSIEIWRHERLVGGLYGVALGRMFFGESMFSVESNASRLALAHFAHQLSAWGFPLLDGQVGSPHLYRMGATDLPRPAFLSAVAKQCAKPAPRTPWKFDVPVPTEPRHLPQDCHRV